MSPRKKRDWKKRETQNDSLECQKKFQKACAQILPTRHPLMKRKEQTGSPLPGGSQDASKSPASSKASDSSKASAFYDISAGSPNL